jgi:GNAT superfamily N-acetyltransferase/ribosomal protein S18 acetylase RimI-like enzyme
MIRIRRAAPAELLRLPSLLPRWNYLPDDECLVAEAADPARVVGTAILGARRLGEDRRVAQIDVTVVPRFRATGLIGQLVSALMTRAAELGCGEISLATPRRRDSPEFPQFQALGFAERHTVITYEFSLPLFAARTRSAGERLLRRRAVPAGARVVGMAPVQWPAAVRLLSSERLLDARTQARAEREGLNVYFSSASRILLVDDRVEGVALNRGRGRHLETTALAVSPRLRGGVGWANALLTWRAAEIGLALGYEVLTMSADPVRHPMTTLLARRMKAIRLGEDIFLSKIIDA